MNVKNPLAYSFIIQDELYLLNKDKIQYQAQAPPPVIAETLAANFNYKGGNKKNFLIIVHYPGHDFINDLHFAALESILKRLAYDTGDVAIFNKASYPGINFIELADFFTPQKLLILGQAALPAGFNKPGLNKVTVVNNYPALLSFSFEEMMDDTDNKKVFWKQMKQL